MTSYNKQLSGIFSKMAAIYRYLGIDERFRVLAYLKAARVIASLQEEITVYAKNGTLEDIPGIGPSIAEKIREFIKTGKISKYEMLKKTTPHEILDMMEIRGFGPQSLNKIHTTLKINTKKELIQALEDGRISKLKGFGNKKVENMMKGLKLHKTIEERMLLWDALNIGNEIIFVLKQLPEVKQIELAGSLRRKKETIGDIDILVSCEEKNRKKIINQFTNMEMAKETLAKGDTKSSIILRDSGKQVDLRIVNEDEWGSALQYFTGSKEHNVHLRAFAKEKGFKISEYGIFLINNEKRVAGKTEEQIYNALGFPFLPPEIREDKGEIELALKNKIPTLITLNDIQGDLQMHSTWSDGVNSIEEIAKYVLKYFQYDYIAITDHSKSSRIAKGINEFELLKQMKEIDDVNEILKRGFVKKGIEVDILADGKLDLSNEILSQLDWVTASIHGNFNADNTKRIIRACENPYVNCIGHPTGRLIGFREPLKIEFKEIIEAAKKTNTALEINAQPERMDLNDELTRQARENGVKLVISTDSHNLGQFDLMQLGVSIARRAWCTKEDVLNTMSWKQMENFTKSKRNKSKIPRKSFA